MASQAGDGVRFPYSLERQTSEASTKVLCWFAEGINRAGGDS